MQEQPSGPTEVTLEQAVHAAIALHRTGLLDDAEALYRRILESAPNDADTLHFLGLLMRQRNRSTEALQLMRKAVAAAPDFASAHNNLGNLLCEAGALEEAARHLLRSLELEPNDPRALNNLGNIARAGGQQEAAIRYFELAAEFSPDFPLPYQNLGYIYLQKGDITQAHNFFCKAVTLDEDLSYSKQFVGMALCELGRHDEARRYYQKWIDSDPANPVAHHLLATVAEGAPPPRASDAYVRTVFDTFAASFDVHLQRLQYRAPELVTQALRAAGASDGAGLMVLDAGCGTGMCGTLVRPIAGRLEGVDLSPRMLERARAGGCYDDLAVDELTHYMASHHDRYDAIVCADTLCYFGELSAVAAAAAAALRPGGCFIFTVEEANARDAGSNYRMHSSGRYAHSEQYVRAACAQARLKVSALVRSGLRLEVGKEVAGLIVTALREPAQAAA